MTRPVADVLAETLETLLPAILGEEEVEPGVFIGKADVRTARRYAEALAAVLADATTDTAAPSYEEGYRAGMDDAAVPEIAALFADDDTTAPVVERILARRVSVDRAKVEAVEALRDNWRRLAGIAMDPDTREWLTATWKSLDAALGAPTATERGGKITHG